MTAPLYVVPTTSVPAGLPPSGVEMTDLLRQLLDAQREQVALLKAQLAAGDQLARWRALLGRWAEEFPGVGGACKQVLPTLERAYLTTLRELAERVKELGDDLEDEFVLTEFLDRFATRVTQLGNILGSVSPIADATPSGPPTA